MKYHLLVLEYLMFDAINKALVFVMLEDMSLLYNCNNF